MDSESNIDFDQQIMSWKLDTSEREDFIEMKYLFPLLKDSNRKVWHWIMKQVLFPYSIFSDTLLGFLPRTWLKKSASSTTFI